MSDFLGKLVERSLSGSSAVRPRLETIYNVPTENGGRFFGAEEQREAMATASPDKGSDRISRIEAMRQPAPQASAEIGSVSVPIAISSLQQSAPDRPSQQQVTSEDNAELRPPKPDALDSPRIGAPIESSPQSVVPEIRTQKVIELIRRESPRLREPGRPLEFGAISQSAPPFRTVTPRSEAREDSAANSINVTIGRVEVRATLPQPAASEKPRTAAPIMSLEEYLRGRAGGNRR
jgi:hypothetical protein